MLALGGGAVLSDGRARGAGAPAARRLAHRAARGAVAARAGGAARPSRPLAADEAAFRALLATREPLYRRGRDGGRRRRRAARADVAAEIAARLCAAPPRRRPRRAKAAPDEAPHGARRVAHVPDPRRARRARRARRRRCAGCAARARSSCSATRTWRRCTSTGPARASSAAGLQRRRRSILPAGEREKSLARAEELYGVLYDRGVRRSDTLVALGGGVIGDLTGFVAATYQRGVGLRAGADDAARAGGRLASAARSPWTSAPARTTSAPSTSRSLVLADLRHAGARCRRASSAAAPPRWPSTACSPGARVLRRVRQLARRRRSRAARRDAGARRGLASQYKAGVVERDEREETGAARRAQPRPHHRPRHRGRDRVPRASRTARPSASGCTRRCGSRGELCRPARGGGAGRRTSCSTASGCRARLTGVRAQDVCDLIGRDKKAGQDGVGYVLLRRPGVPRHRRARPAGARTGGGGMAAKALKTLWLLHGVNLDMLGRRDPARVRQHDADGARGLRGAARRGARLHGAQLPDQPRGRVRREAAPARRATARTR